jgi:hypothetical protein
MQWNTNNKNSREILKIDVTDISLHTKTNITLIKWANLRTTVLKKYNYTCRYCNGKYMKYLQCIHLDNDSHNNNLSNLDLCCHACYIITHINSVYNNEIQPCWSKLSQLDIVRKSVDFVVKNNKIPSVLDIDSDAKQIDLSIMELSNILVCTKEKIILPKELNNYKLFFTQQFNTRFVDLNIFMNTPMFIDEVEQTEQIEPKNNIISNYNFSKNEITFFKTIF